MAYEEMCADDMFDLAPNAGHSKKRFANIEASKPARLIEGAVIATVGAVGIATVMAVEKGEKFADKLRGRNQPLPVEGVTETPAYDAPHITELDVHTGYTFHPARDPRIGDDPRL